jgi:hypothetical protein
VSGELAPSLFVVARQPAGRRPAALPRSAAARARPRAEGAGALACDRARLLPSLRPTLARRRRDRRRGASARLPPTRVGGRSRPRPAAAGALAVRLHPAKKGVRRSSRKREDRASGIPAAASRPDASLPSRRRPRSIPARATPTASASKTPAPCPRPSPPATTPSTPMIDVCLRPGAQKPRQPRRHAFRQAARYPAPTARRAPARRGCRRSPLQRPLQARTPRRRLARSPAHPTSGSLPGQPDRLHRHTPPRRRLDPPLPHHRPHGHSRAELPSAARTRLRVSDPYRDELIHTLLHREGGRRFVARRGKLARDSGRVC